MKKELTQNRKIIMGYVLETENSEESDKKSYDDMKVIGRIRVADSLEVEGDDLNDAPYDCNGNIYSGEVIELEKGDVVIVIKK